jgi:hypothetical protein
MKKLLIAAALVTLTAAPSLAFVQAGHTSNPGSVAPQSVRSTHIEVGANGGGPSSGGNTLGTGINEPSNPSDGDPTRPVPEPGMMALASMGLLALGVASRKRQAKQ